LNQKTKKKTCALVRTPEANTLSVQEREQESCFSHGSKNKNRQNRFRIILVDFRFIRVTRVFSLRVVTSPLCPDRNRNIGYHRVPVAQYFKNMIFKTTPTALTSVC